MRTAETNSEGIGLGLMICQNIVLKSGGSMRAQSKGKDKGATFAFSMMMEHVIESPKELQALPKLRVSNLFADMINRTESQESECD